MSREQRIAAAAERIENAAVIYDAARASGVPFHLACAFAEEETRGANVFGGDGGPRPEVYAHAPGGVPAHVTPARYVELLVHVMNGAVSNGVGVFQITFAGEPVTGPHGVHRDGGDFTQMADLGLSPWVPYENALYALRFLVLPLTNRYPVAEAAAHYNGGTHPDAAAEAYGLRVRDLDLAYQHLFGLR